MKLDDYKLVTLSSIISLIKDRAMACQTLNIMIADDKKKKGKANPKFIHDFDELWKMVKEEERHLLSQIEWWLDEAYNNGVTDGRRSK